MQQKEVYLKDQLEELVARVSDRCGQDLLRVVNDVDAQGGNEECWSRLIDGGNIWETISGRVVNLGNFGGYIQSLLEMNSLSNVCRVMSDKGGWAAYGANARLCERII